MRKYFEVGHGSFTPALFVIKIEKFIEFDDFENNNDEDKGTFVHEYCHYLQDVSTTFGYINFNYYVQILFTKLKVLNRIDDYYSDFYSLYRGEKNINEEISVISKIEVLYEDFYVNEYPDQDNRYVNVSYYNRYKKKRVCFWCLLYFGKHGIFD